MDFVLLILISWLFSALAQLKCHSFWGLMTIICWLWQEPLCFQLQQMMYLCIKWCLVVSLQTWEYSAFLECFSFLYICCIEPVVIWVLRPLLFSLPFFGPCPSQEVFSSFLQIPQRIERKGKPPSCNFLGHNFSLAHDIRHILLEAKAVSICTDDSFSCCHPCPPPFIFS